MEDQGSVRGIFDPSVPRLKAPGAVGLECSCETLSFFLFDDLSSGLDVETGYSHVTLGLQEAAALKFEEELAEAVPASDG